MRTFAGQLLRFALTEVSACAFAVALFAGLAAATIGLIAGLSVLVDTLDSA